MPRARREGNQRRSRRSSRAPVPLIIGGVVLGVAILQVVRTVAGARRVPLRSEWSRIPSVRRSTSLAVHARMSDDVATSLPPVVLLHGYGMGSSYFIPLAARLRNNAHVYAPDLPGHGPSERDVRPLSIRELGDALAAWMDANGLRAAVLVGHSAGSQVAVDVAARRADLVSGLVLVAPACDPTARSVVRQVVRSVRGAIFERPGVAIWAALDFPRSGIRVLVAELRDLIAHRIEDVLPRVRVPVRVVRGRWDQLVPQRWAATVARLAGAPPPIVIDRWSHAVHYGDPDAVAGVVLELAEEVSRGSVDIGDPVTVPTGTRTRGSGAD